MPPYPTPLSAREKWAYGMGDSGANLVGQMQITFLLFFYTDVLRIPAATAGSILLVSRVLDAIIDPLVGALSDRTATRWGRYRPWILASAVPLAIALVLCYTVPALGPAGRIAWAIVTYNLLMILYAANNIPYCALSGVMTDESLERTSLATWRFVCAMLATLVVNVFTLDAVRRWGDTDSAVGFQSVAVVWGTAAVACFAITFAFTRERIEPDAKQHASLRQDLSSLLRSAPWVALFCLAVLIHIQLALRGGTMLYYFTHYVARQAPVWGLSPFGLFNGVGLAVVMIGVVLAKPLAERFGKRTTIRVSLLLSSALMASFAFVPRDAIVALFALQVLLQLSFGPSIPLLWTMMADVADYAEWKTLRRSTALAFASIVFGLKLGTGVGAWLSGKWLAHIGYSADGVQSPETLRGIVATISVFPAAALFVGWIVLFFYPIDNAVERQMRESLRARRGDANVER